MPKRSGVEIDLRKLKGLPDAVGSATRAELGKIALDLLGEAVNEAPVKEGTLRGSGSAHVSGRRIATGADMGAGAADATPVEGGADTGEFEAAVVFNTLYAAYQHENVEFNHPKGGKAKYLSDPFERNTPQYQRKLAEAIARDALK